MKCFETSALSGQGVDALFYTMIDDITEMQQSGKKKLNEEDDIDLQPPMTNDKFQSQKKTVMSNGEGNDNVITSNFKLKCEKVSWWRKFCCPSS